MGDDETQAQNERAPIFSILIAIAPWMFLATVLRTFGVVSYPGGMMLIHAAEIPLIIAFLTACQLSIEFTGGSVAYSRAGVFQRVAMGKEILWRVALIGLALHYGAVAAGLTFIHGKPVAYGFDALAFNRFQDFLLPWSLAIGLLTFLMAVEKARGRQVSLYGAARLLAGHWRALSLSFVMLAPALAAMNMVQLAIGPPIKGVVSIFGSPMLTASATVFYLFAFACLRVVGVVVAFTLALRWSWPSEGYPGNSSPISR